MFTRGTSAIMGDVHPREKLVPPKAERARSTTGKKDAASSDMPVDSKPKRGTAQKDNRDKKRETAFAIMGDNGNRCPSASGGEVTGQKNLAGETVSAHGISSCYAGGQQKMHVKGMTFGFDSPSRRNLASLSSDSAGFNAPSLTSKRERSPPPRVSATGSSGWC